MLKEVAMKMWNIQQRINKVWCCNIQEALYGNVFKILCYIAISILELILTLKT